MIIRDSVLIGWVVESLPNWLGICLITVLGPASILSVADSIGLFATTLAVVFGCLATARICWRLWPGTEWFVVPLLAAAIIWGVSGWLVMIVAGV